MDGQAKCFVCDRVASVREDGAWLVDCHWCGPYFIRYAIQEDIASDSEASVLLPYLAAHIRQSPRDGRWFEVGTDWKDAARGHANTSISQKARMLLELVARRSRVGKSLEIPFDEIQPWIDAHDLDEVRFLLKHLEASEHIYLAIVSIPAEGCGFRKF